ncbi:hypothetical protein FN846DRAFT_888443 [Sphaerosporella brunnea]|uniref:Uncharacterized protein n=1 Tax=Sphaerosporella brunnea TaxID=1250544 RepID=A0A5J5F363_9PEZI|nr:hypothetical protein FN846DRAFT_888443 [Sphaerosporella brunnea]
MYIEWSTRLWRPMLLTQQKKPPPPSAPSLPLTSKAAPPDKERNAELLKLVCNDRPDSGTSRDSDCARRHFVWGAKSQSLVDMRIPGESQEDRANENEGISAVEWGNPTCLRYSSYLRTICRSSVPGRLSPFQPADGLACWIRVPRPYEVWASVSITSLFGQPMQAKRHARVDVSDSQCLQRNNDSAGAHVDPRPHAVVLCMKLTSAYYYLSSIVGKQIAQVPRT